MKPEAWPRRGYPILPRFLRDLWGRERVPRPIIERLGLSEEIAFRELDGAFWRRLSDDSDVGLLANHLSALVLSRLYSATPTELATQMEAVERVLPCTPDDDELLNRLPLSARTRNALARSGRLSDAGWIAKAGVADLLAIRGLGSKSFLEFATVLEGAVDAEPRHALGNRSEQGPEFVSKHGEVPVLPAGAAQSILERIREIDGMTDAAISDPLMVSILPPVGSWPIEVDRRSELVLDELSLLASAVTSRDEDEDVADLLNEFRQAIEEFRGLKLDEALVLFLELSVPGEHRAALAARLGWDGQGGTTLQQAGDLSGISRERVRQLQRKAEKVLSHVVYFPQLHDAIEALEEAAAELEQDASLLLFRSGITSRPFLPSGVVVAARTFGIEHEFEVQPDGLAVAVPGIDNGAFSTAWKSLSDLNYVASVSEFHERVREHGAAEITEENARRWLGRRDRVVWLDPSRSWFWVQQGEGRARYYNIARKILAVSGRVSLTSIRDAIMRHLRYRGQSVSLPGTVLARYLEVCGCDIDDEGYVTSKSPDLDELTANELIIVDVLRANGNVMRGWEFRQECINRGVNRHSIQVYSSYSPLLQRLMPGVYCLRGADVDPGRVAVVNDRGARPAERQVQDSGWTIDGAHWIGYRVTRNIWETGIVSVPAGVREILGELRLPLYTTDGQEVGTFAIGDAGNAWGLSPFIDRRGVEVGDSLVIAIDTDLECALVQAGGSDLLEEYSDGDGWGVRKALEEVTRPED